MIAYSNDARPTSESTAPIGSSGVTFSSLLSGASTATTTSTRAAAIVLTRNVEPHQCDGKIHQSVRRNPTMSGPSAPPAPAKPAHSAIALRRSSGGKIDVNNDSVDGITNAAPNPITLLLTMTAVEVSATVPMAPPSPNTASPNISARLRPNRSPSAPAVSRNPANTIAYESKIHCRSVAVASRSRWIEGIAVLSPDTPITTITSDRHITPSRNHRLAWIAGSSWRGRRFGVASGEEVMLGSDLGMPCGPHPAKRYRFASKRRRLT